MLLIENISKKLDSRIILDQINLKVLNEIHILKGENGSGKSTLLKILSGFYQPDQGQIYLNNSDITLRPVEKRRIGYVSQKNFLYPHLTIEENIFISPYAQKNPNLENLFHYLQLDNKLSLFPQELSGGFQSRVCLARALSCAPHLLLLDEPFAHQDQPLKSDILPYLKTYLEDLKIPILLITHDSFEANLLGNSITYIKNGQIVDN